MWTSVRKWLLWVAFCSAQNNGDVNRECLWLDMMAASVGSWVHNIFVFYDSSRCVNAIYKKKKYWNPCTSMGVKLVQRGITWHTAALDLVFGMKNEFHIIINEYCISLSLDHVQKTYMSNKLISCVCWGSTPKITQYISISILNWKNQQVMTLFNCFQLRISNSCYYNSLN